MNETDYSRFVTLSGSLNFRDFGGYRTSDGRQVKWRTLFRSGALSMLSDEAKAGFGELNIAVICDLRKADEATRSSTPDLPPFDCKRNIPIEQASNKMLREAMMDSNKTASDRIGFAIETNRELARNHHKEYRQLFEILLETDGGFLLHCSAGKDRTGFGAALILATLGVDEETIMEDYLLTNQAQCLQDFTESTLRRFYGEHIDDASMEVIGGVRQEFLQAALDEVKVLHGTIAGYLEEIGIDENSKNELLRKLLVS